MSKRLLDPREARVWHLHMSGCTVSEIAAATRHDEGFIRTVITGVWADDCQVQVMKDAA